MKTAVSELQEFMVKRNEVPLFDCISQSGPPHEMIFKYQCSAAGVTVQAIARSKKDAKQESARLCLLELAARGKYKLSQQTAPPPQCYTNQPQYSGAHDECELSTKSYVALLKEFCEEYHLPGMSCELISDTGPPHCREFEIQVSVGEHAFRAISSTKKVARQMACERLYKYLRDNLHKISCDFEEGEALVRSREKAMDRYKQMKEEALPWRPNLGQKVSEYHLDEKPRTAAQCVIDDTVSTDNMVDRVELLLKELGYQWEWEQLQTFERYKVIMVLHVPQAYPAIAIMGPAEVEALAKELTAQEALNYFKVMLA